VSKVTVLGAYLLLIRPFPRVLADLDIESGDHVSKNSDSMARNGNRTGITQWRQAISGRRPSEQRAWLFPGESDVAEL